MSTQQDFRDQVEGFLKAQGMGAATLGSQALKDPKFVFDLRKGRSPSLKTIDRVRAWMATHEAAGSAELESPAAEGAPRASGGRARSLLPMVGVGMVLVAAAGVYFWPTLGSLLERAMAPPDQPSEVADTSAPVQHIPGQQTPGSQSPDQQRPGPPSDDRLAVYARRLAAAEGHIRALEAGAESRRAGFEDLSRRLQTLEAAPSGSPVAIPDPAVAVTQARLRRDVAGLAARLEGLEQQPGGDHGLRLMLAFMRLDKAVAAQRTFGPALRAVAALLEVPGDDSETVGALTALKKRAEGGVLDGRALVRQLAPLLRPAQRAAAVPADAVWWRQSLARLASLVTIRPQAGSGGNPGDATPAALLARAEAAMARGDVGNAVAALEKLPPGGLAVVEPWRQAALDHLAVHGALDILEARGLEGLWRADNAAAAQPQNGGARP